MDSKYAGGSQLAHFLTDETGAKCGDFTFNEHDLLLTCSQEINLNGQPAQIMVNHPKIPGLSWVIFFYQTGPNQYQPRIAYDFPTYLRVDADMTIQLAGMNWSIKHKFEGSSWLTSALPPKNMNERWSTIGTVKKAEIRVSISKVWFKFPLFTACCHPIKTKRIVRQPDFTIPDQFADCQLIPQDPHNRKLYAHRQILAMNSPWFYERFKNINSLNCGDVGPSISVPFEFECVHNFLRFIYPNGDLEIDAQNVEGLMDIGKEYHIPYIIRQCEKFLYTYMEGGSAVLAYYLGRKQELPALQDAALLHLSELNSSQLRSQIALDMKMKSANTQEILLNDLCHRLCN